jgi:flavin reductase (DIM6/NTAB) family NADH-FMN oxidoreductase RutF/enamine deaminase RidA (YjgF/YER057c/UK114 family)
MSHAACTVNVVTTDGAAGRHGLTVSAMASVSADTEKPTLLVCIDERSPAAAAMLSNGVFCVNILRDDQAVISDTFAGRLKHVVADKFECARWTTQVTGAPRVVDPLVAFDCRITASEQVGSHHVVFGSVEDIFIAPGGSPLIYANRAYGSARRFEIRAGGAATRAGTAGPLAIGCFQTIGPYVLPNLVARLRNRDPEVEFKIFEGNQREVVESLRRGETELALLYDFGLDRGIAATTLAELVPYVLLPEGHPLAALAAIELETLVTEPMILLDVEPSRDYFLSLFRTLGLEPSIGCRSLSFEMVRGLVGHGLGYSLLATKPANNMSYDGRALVARPLANPVANSRLVLARLEGRPLSAAAAVFAEQCVTFFNPCKFNTRDTYPEQKLDNDLCQTVVAEGRMVFVRGQVGQDLETAATVGVGDPAAQAERAMANIAQLLDEAGSRLEHVCKITIYLTDPRFRETVYRTVGRWLKGVYPVSTGIVVSALARPEWLVEIDVIAVIPSERPA